MILISCILENPTLNPFITTSHPFGVGVLTRPAYVPAITFFLSLRMVALTKSPVEMCLNICFDAVQGKPYLSILVILLHPWPVAFTLKILLIKTFSVSTTPTQAASSQCVLGSSNWVRLNLVKPPEPVETDMPVCFSTSNSFHRVELTAAASFRGRLAWSWIFFKNSGFLTKKSLMSWVPFFWLQSSHARQRFEIRFVPPLAFGWICSTWSGTFSTLQ